MFSRSPKTMLRDSTDYLLDRFKILRIHLFGVAHDLFSVFGFLRSLGRIATWKIGILASVASLVVALSALYFISNTESRVDHLQSEADAHIERCEFAEAVTCLETIVEIKPDCNVQVSISLMKAYVQLGEVSKADELLSKLAPESGLPGAKEGHRLMAIGLTNEIRLGADNQAKANPMASTK